MPQRTVSTLLLLAAAACSPPLGATDRRIDGRLADRLDATYRDALTADRCAREKPYLNPLYPLPGSADLARSVQQGATVGLGEILERTRRQWSERQARAPSACPDLSPGDRHDTLLQAVRTFDEALDPAIDQALARTPPAAPGTSPQLVAALVAARWGAEHSLTTNCISGDSRTVAKSEKARLQALRQRAVQLGRAADAAAAERRWAAEKVNFDRDTALFDMMIPCKVEQLRTANDRIERLLAELG